MPVVCAACTQLGRALLCVITLCLSSVKKLKLKHLMVKILQGCQELWLFGVEFLKKDQISVQTHHGEFLAFKY